MEAAELLKKVRKIEIKTKGLSNQLFSGHYHSAFKGRGMTFTEVREYQYGDDIRNIDWNVTARFNHPYVKVFEEERELTVVLLIDVSGSNDFGTVNKLKKEVITELAAVLSFSAIHNNDKVGVIFFSDIIEKFIPPKKGTKHILRIIRELIDFKPKQTGTNISEALKYLRSAIKKSSIAFLISDFNIKGFDNALKIASKKHDLILIKIYDQRENTLPAAGLMKFKDAETNKITWIDTSSKNVRDNYFNKVQAHENYLKTLFSKAGVDVANISANQDYVPPLSKLFKIRSRRF